MRLLSLMVLLSAGIACQATLRRFDNYKLYKLYVNDNDQARELNEWYQKGKLDFWSYSGVNHSVTVMVHSGLDVPFEQMLDEEQIESDVIEENVQLLLEEEQEQRMLNVSKKRGRPEQVDPVDFFHFWTLDEITRYLEQLEKRFPKLVRVMEVGRTAENRTISAVSISRNRRIDQTRPVVLIDAGMHAREWASHMSVMYLISELVENSDAYDDMLEDTDWLIVPVMNPDGYVYSHESNRLWRKNRYTGNVLCPGVDINRNFPFRWSYTSHSCTDGYSGRAPGSERETQAMMLLMAEFAPSIKVYLSVHACGNYVLYPYGYDYQPAPNADALHALGMAAAQAATKMSGSHYDVGNAAELMYPANGSDDFIYGSYGVEYAYTLELSCGKRGNGFIIDRRQIQPIANEAFEMFRVFGVFAGKQTVPKHQ